MNRMNRTERVQVVRAMELLARSVNDESVFEYWLDMGVADEDITEDTRDDDSIFDWYIEDDNFSELMDTFLKLMAMARKSGGLQCDGVVSG